MCLEFQTSSEDGSGTMSSYFIYYAEANVVCKDADNRKYPRLWRERRFGANSDRQREGPNRIGSGLRAFTTEDQLPAPA